MRKPEEPGPQKTKWNKTIAGVIAIVAASILLFTIFSDKNQSPHTATQNALSRPQKSIVNVGKITIQSTRKERSTEKDTDKKRIELLLEQATADMSEFRLTTPSGNNAYAKYSEILQMEPDNTAARKGVEKIVTTYVDMVMVSLGKYDFTKGKRYLERAISISADKAALIKLQKQIEQLERQYKQTAN